MANIDAQSVDLDGLTPVYSAAAAGGDAVAAGDEVVYHFKNASAGAITVTAVTPGTVQGLAVEDRALVVPANSELFVKLPPSMFQNPSTKRVNLTYSGVVSLSLAVLTV